MKTRTLLLFIWFAIGVAIPATSKPLKTEDGFLIPPENLTLRFPKDHGSHPNYKIEWWYFTGHLRTKTEREFGFQITFFRYANRAPGQDSNSSENQDDFNEDQMFLAHVALTDIESGKFHFQERLNRSGWDACSSTSGMDIRNGNWTAVMNWNDGETETIETIATIRSDIKMEFLLKPEKPLIRFGEENGLSIKGPNRENCSIYFSYTRLTLTGTVVLKGETFDVTGESWMDHEFSSSQLGDGMIGWDWTCIQFENDWEIKAYILRDKDGLPSEFSRLIWIEPDGTLHYQYPPEWKWETAGQWESPVSGTRYPNRIKLTSTHPTEKREVTLMIDPKLDGQEILPEISETSYWEGACWVKNSNGQILGNAYVELTGYDKPLTTGIR